MPGGLMSALLSEGPTSGIGAKGWISSASSCICPRNFLRKPLNSREDLIGSLPAYSKGVRAYVTAKEVN